jgi:uncharacterized protein
MKLYTVVLSEKCNLNCSYCGVDKWSKKSIDPDLCVQEFWNLREKYPDEKIQVDFFGGEPLLHLDLVKKIIEKIKNDKNIKFFMPTNALLLNENIVEYLNENNVEVKISFDGLWQDKNRLQLNGKGTLNKFLEKRELFKKIPDVTCHTMIDKGCYNLLENHLWIKENFGFNPHLTLVRDLGTWNNNRVEKLKEGITEIFDWYTNNTHEEIPFFIVYYLRHFLNYSIKKYEKEYCGAGTDILMFDENKVIPCTRFKREPELIQEIPNYIKMNVCQTCEVKNYCEKGCLFEQIKNKGPIEELCDIYKYLYHKVRTMCSILKEDLNFKTMLMEEIKNG